MFHFHVIFIVREWTHYNEFVCRPTASSALAQMTHTYSCMSLLLFVVPRRMPYRYSKARLWST